MGSKTTFMRAKEAIEAAQARGCTREEITAAMGYGNIGQVPGGKAGREKAIAAITALQPPDQPAGLEIHAMKPLSKEVIAALEASTIQTKVIHHPDGRKERVAVPFDRAKEGSERTVVVVVNSTMDKTGYQKVRDDLIKGFADAAKGMKKAAEKMSEAFPKAKGVDHFATGGVVSAEALRLGTIAHESMRKVGMDPALGAGYDAYRNTINGVPVELLHMPDKDANFLETYTSGPAEQSRREKYMAVLNDGCGRKFLADGTRVFTSPPLPPAKPALPVQKVWPIGMGLLGTAYKEYD